METKIKKINKEFVFVEKEEKPVISFSNKGNKIFIYDNKLVEEIFNNKFNNKYKKLLYLIMSINEDEDATDTDIELIYLKIDNLRNLLLTKYYKYLSKSNLNKYLKMLALLEEKINIKKRGKSR